MFLLQYALEVKLGEKTRLETILKVDRQNLLKFYRVWTLSRRMRSLGFVKRRLSLNLRSRLLTIFSRKTTEKLWRLRKSKPFRIRL